MSYFLLITGFPFASPLFLAPGAGKRFLTNLRAKSNLVSKEIPIEQADRAS
jgi:hypothetical protein